jgi:hypothetical protein
VDTYFAGADTTGFGAGFFAALAFFFLLAILSPMVETFHVLTVVRHPAERNAAITSLRYISVLFSTRLPVFDAEPMAPKTLQTGQKFCNAQQRSADFAKLRAPDSKYAKPY